ncbi:MAG: DUF3108 domain-containing protein [Candidatus Omnitrophica bacterium]|nr:DUF3108 domain-containing protein [Candidatus Omnitrophota bacterium]
MYKTTLFAILLLLLPGITIAQDANDAFLHGYEHTNVVYFNSKTRQLRSFHTYTLQKENDPGRQRYRLTTFGTGDFDTFSYIDLATSATLEVRNGIVHTLYTEYIAKRKNGKLLQTHTKKFDYDKKTITWEAYNSKGKLLKSIIFPLKGITTDDISLVHFLKSFITEQKKQKTENFYFITDEPRLYKLRIKVLPRETLRTPLGKKEALHLRLTIDAGFLDNLLGSLAPHIDVWFETKPPYDWLQYKGQETGMCSTPVIVYITRRLFQIE